MLAVLAVVFPVTLDVFLSACTGRERLTGRVGGRAHGYVKGD